MNRNEQHDLGEPFQIPTNNGIDSAPALRFFFLNALVNFFPMYRDVLGGRDTEADLVAFHPQHRDLYLITNVQAFAYPSG